MEKETSRLLCLSCRGTNIKDVPYGRALIGMGTRGKKKWKVEVRASAPMRIIGVDGWTLRDELKYYDVGVAAFGNFVGVTDRAVAYWLSGEKEMPHSVVGLMGVLSMFPPMWVRNRLLGEVRMFDRVYTKARLQERFKEGGGNGHDEDNA